MHRNVDNELETMIKSIVQSQLENVIRSTLSDDDRKDEPIMANKFKERVKIGEDTYAWACGNTKEELHQAIAALLSGKEPSVVPSGTKDELWEVRAQHWYETFHKPKIRPKTEVKDASLMRHHVIPAFQGKMMREITTLDVQAFLQTKQDYCKSQVRDIMALMKAIFADAVEDGTITKNPMDSQRIYNPSKKQDQPRRALTVDEQADIISHLNDLKEPNARRFMAMLMFTCMRPCEIYGLRWEDVDLKAMTINVNRNCVFVSGKVVIGDTKTEESARPIPISPQLLDYLLPLKNSGPIIEGITSETASRKMWKYIKETIDVHGMTPYMGRHTFASNMNRMGVPIKTAMSLMGHTDERMLLRRYTHVESTDLCNANNTITSYLTSLGNIAK